MVNKVKNKVRLYRLINYPKEGMEYGNFKAKYPYLAAHKVINFLKVSNEDKHNMAKFWLREYVQLDKLFINLVLYCKSKMVNLTNLELNNIFILLYINLLTHTKIIKDKDLKNINLDKHIKEFKKMNKKLLINLIIILLIQYYKRFNINISNISRLLSKNLKKLNSNDNIENNLSNIIISNHNKIKIPKIFEHLILKIYISRETKDGNHIKHHKRLHKNLNFA